MVEAFAYRQGTMMNLKEIKELIELISEKGFAEFEIERQGFRLRVSRFKDGAPPPPPLASAPIMISPALHSALEVSAAPLSRADASAGEPPGHGPTEEIRAPSSRRALLQPLLERLQAIREGERTLLGNSMIMMGSSLSDGNRHDPNNLPILLGGKGGGRIQAGRHLASPSNTPLCNLYLAQLHCMGVDVPRFGDSTEMLRGLLA